MGSIHIVKPTSDLGIYQNTIYLQYNMLYVIHTMFGDMELSIYDK